MANAPGFMLYDERFGQLNLLTDAQVGKVIKAAGIYKATGEIPKLSKAEMLVFMPLQRDIDTNKVKYDAICERNRSNGEKGGAPKGNQNASKQPSGLKNNPVAPTGPQSNPKQPNQNVNTNQNQNANLNSFYKGGSTAPVAGEKNDPDSDFEEKRRLAIELLRGD